MKICQENTARICEELDYLQRKASTRLLYVEDIFIAVERADASIKKAGIGDGLGTRVFISTQEAVAKAYKYKLQHSSALIERRRDGWHLVSVARVEARPTQSQQVKFSIHLPKKGE